MFNDIKTAQKDYKVLRVVLKDPGYFLDTKRDFDFEALTLFVGPAGECKDKLTNLNALNAYDQKFKGSMRLDSNYLTESDQIRRQSIFANSVAYYKLYNIRGVDAKTEISFIYDNQHVYSFKLKELIEEKEKLTAFKKIECNCKFQENGSLFIFSTDAHLAREEEQIRRAERGQDDKNIVEQIFGEMGSNKRPNPFTKKLTKNETSAFQNLYNSPLLNQLYNYMYLNAGNGAAVIEGMIKIGNGYFDGDFEDMSKREYWMATLREFYRVCQQTLSGRNRNRDEELTLEEGPAEQVMGENRNQPALEFAFGKYDISEISYFSKKYKSEIAVYFCHNDLNEKIFNALDCDFISTLFGSKLHEKGPGVLNNKLEKKRQLRETFETLFTSLVRKDEVLLRYLAQCYHYYHLQELSSGLLKAAAEYIKTIIKFKLKSFQSIITNNDQVRALYFKGLSHLISSSGAVIDEPVAGLDDEFVIRSYDIDERVDLSSLVLGTLLFEDLLKDIPNLQSDFYCYVFASKATLPRLKEGFFKQYLENQEISEEVRVRQLKLLYSPDKVASRAMARFVYNALTAEQYVKGFSGLKLFAEVDGLFFGDRVFNFMEFMRTAEPLPLYEQILLGLRNSNVAAIHKHIEQRGDSYFSNLFLDVQAFLKKSETDIRIEFLLNKSVLTDKKCLLFERLITGHDKESSLFRNAVAMHRGSLNEATANLNEFGRQLKRHEIYFQEYGFYSAHREELQAMKAKFEELNLRNVLNNRVYLDSMPLLQAREWGQYAELQNYKHFYESLKARCPWEVTMPQYYQAILEEMGNYRALFTKFVKTDTYSFHEYRLYLPRITFPDKHLLYQKVFTNLSIKEADVNALFYNTRVFHSLANCLKICEYLAVLSDKKFFSLKKSPYMDALKALHTLYKDKNPATITLTDVIKNDKSKILSNPDFTNSPTYNMPMMIKVLATSPSCFKFVRETADEFIKSMREEVDNENLDIVNKLDIINKHLKTVVAKSDLEEIVRTLMQVSKEDQRKIKAHLRFLEGQIDTHIIHLADKTKNDISYNQKIMKNILEDSVIKIVYQPGEKKFVIAVKYEKGKYTMNTTEFDELYNKSKIIVSEGSTHQGEYQQLMVEFMAFGDEFSSLCAMFVKLRHLGLISSNFIDIVPFMNLSEPQKKLFSSEEKDKHAELSIVYKKSENHMKVIQQATQRLRELEEQLSKELIEYYSPECYLMCYFYGKKLYHLTEFLKGRATEFEAKQSLSIITESIPKNLINFNQRYEFSPELSRTFSEVHRILRTWNNNVKSKDRIKLNNSSVFTMKKIGVCTTQVNPYEVIVKILYEANESISSLSQILFCRANITKNEIYSFIKRAMLDPFKRIYFILNLESMDYLMIMEMKNCILRVIESLYDNLNFNLLIINNSGSQNKNLFDNEDFENINHSVTQLNSIIKQEDYQKSFYSLFTTNLVVMSETAGMGKTDYIDRHLNNKYPMFDLFLSGEINTESISKRLNFLGKSTQKIDHFATKIKLDFIEDFDANIMLIDYLLFCICIIKRFYTGVGCLDLRDNMNMVYIEIGNTFLSELITKLQVLQLLDNKTGGPSTYQYRVILPSFSLDNIWYSSDPKSLEQKTGSFLHLLDRNELKDKDILQNASVIPRDRYLELVKKYFMLDFLKERSEKERTDSTFSQYQFWIKSLAYLVDQFEATPEFSIAKLKGNDKITVELREEIGLEMLRFCSHIINVSVGQAKNSQDEMKHIISTIQKEHLQKKNIEEYKTKFSKIEPWDSSNLIVPLFFQKRVLFSLTNLEYIFNTEKLAPSNAPNPRFRKRKILREFIKEIKGFIELEKKETKNFSNECLTLLAKLTNQSPEALILKSSTFKNKGFVVTLDNFMKISLIILKAELKIPIVVMGESGCGKTYLSLFVAECILKEELRELTLYSGVSEGDFIKFMSSAIDRAKELSKENKRLWIFFDEFNTSCLQSIVAEIMIDRVCSIDPSIYQIPDNLIFISCCNPYRMKTKRTDVGLVPKTTDSLLSHRVYPIPERLLNYIWDFGQLSEDDEQKHILSIICSEKIFDSAKDTAKEKRFSNMVYWAHKCVRDIEERSGVSLRDIKRVINLYKWFRTTMEYLVNECGITNLKKTDIHMKASICAIFVSYGLRLNGKDDDQKKLYDVIFKGAKLESTMQAPKLSDIKAALSSMADVYLKILSETTPKIIPENIALNRPLKENFITMLACFDTLTPLIICGAPGTSKTLTTQIFDSALVPNIIRKQKIFGKFKGINSMYYGGSQSSTSEGISKVYNRAAQYLRNKGEDRPVVVFDEIGLAELSPYNPLKILHPLLEKPDQDVGFFGLSNWTLDLSKMNRLIYLARPDMAKEDLVEIFKISIANCSNEKAKNDITTYLNILAETYLDFRVWQKNHGTHPNFHGSRDIYGVSKFIYNQIARMKEYDSSKINNLIKLSIERNFNGAAYIFGSSENMIAFETVEGLINFKNKDNFTNMRVEDLGNPYSLVVKPLTELSIYNSSQIFKQLFLNKLKANKIQSIFEEDFLSEYHVLDLVGGNINDLASRFLLIKSEGEVVDNIFMEKLARLAKGEKIVDWRGIKGKENSHELLSTLKSYISLGYLVVMKNLDELYGSLYDLFNQKYSEVEGRKYCYLYFGENKHRVDVHPDFKAIILLDAENELQGLELELDQPAPFLNRFEKFFVRLSNILTDSNLKQIHGTILELQQILKGQFFSYLSLSIDMITSICVNAESNKTAQPSETIHSYLMRLTTTNYLLSPNLTPERLDQFAAEHPYSTIHEVVDEMLVKKEFKLCLYTFSNPIELEALKKSIESKLSVQIITSEELIHMGLEKRSLFVKNYKNATIVVQFNNLEHLLLTSQLKNLLAENRGIKKYLFVIHLERRAKDNQIITRNVGLNFWKDWDNRVLENLNFTNYRELRDIYGCSYEEVLFSEKYETGRSIVKEGVLSCLQRIIIEVHDGNLKHNLNDIREMLYNDPENSVSLLLMAKLKQSGLIVCKDNWMDLISRSVKSSETYADLHAEFFNIFNSKFSDLLKKYLIKLHSELPNLGSYASCFFLPDEEGQIAAIYKENLIAKINATRFGKDSVDHIKLNEILSFKIPFLSKVYQEMMKEYKPLLNEDKKMYDQLYDLQIQYTELLHSKSANSSLIQEIAKSVIAGETYISRSVNQIVNSATAKLSKTFPQILKFDKLKDFLKFDLAIILLRKKTDLFEAKYDFFCEFCKVFMNNDANLIIPFLICVCVISNCFYADLLYIFRLIEISNISLNEFTKLVAGFKKDTGAKFDYNYELFSFVMKNLQGRVIPDFADENVNLVLLKNRYTEMLNDSKSNENEQGNTNARNYDLKYMIILLDLLDKLPPHEKNQFLVELNHLKKEQDRFGGEFDIRFIKDFIIKVFKAVHLIKNVDLEGSCVVLSEYINANFHNFNFNLFVGDDFDALFSVFSQRQVEKIAGSLAHMIAGKISNFYSLKKLSAMLESIEFNRTLTLYDAFLSDIDLTKHRNYALIICLIDKFVYNGFEVSNTELPATEFIELFKFVVSKVDFKKNVTGLRNLILYSIIRLIYCPRNMATLKENPEVIKTYDALVIEMSRSKEYFVDNPDTWNYLYFLQKMIVDSGDMSQYQMNYTSVRNICGLLMDEDSSGKIISFEKDTLEYYVNLDNKLSDCAYNKRVDEMKSLIQAKFKNSHSLNLYLVGTILINKFVNAVSKEDKNILENIKQAFIDALSKVALNEHYRELLYAIIKGNKFEFSAFLGDISDNPNFAVRLKKVFYQYLLLVFCFSEEMGYDLNFWKSWKEGSFSNSCLKAPVVFSDEVSNVGSIFENIVVERLNDGSYQDYGGNLGANLGIYKCSCDFVYSIGNCGYAMAKSKCPRCGKEIGGGDHAHLKREGHDHIQTLEEFNKLIQKQYKKKAGNYCPHPVINNTSLELVPVRLAEMGLNQVVGCIKKKTGNDELGNYNLKFYMRHLFDHMLIISLPEVLDEAGNVEFDKKIKMLINYSNPAFKELLGRMAGRTITNPKEYFLAHIKNDLERLSENFKFVNPIDIFDYMRAILSKISERLASGKKMSTSEILVTEADMRNPKRILEEQEEYNNKIKNSQLDTKFVVKNILFRKIRPGLIKTFMSQHGQAFEHIYNFMRHSNFERVKIITEFKKKLAISENGFLKNVVKYESVLRDFPQMVDTNIRLPYYLNNTYNRCYNFDETTELDIVKMDDITLSNLYKDFTHVWTKIIPKHEDTNPEIFSFAFMCQQNLNVANYIDSLLQPAGAKLIKFLFVDPNDYPSQELLYMKSILRTFVEKFHNMMVEKGNKILNLEDKNSIKKNIEYCTADDYITFCNYEQHVLNNFWYETSVDKENHIDFNLERIEYLCAQDMKKPLINFEEKDLKYYSFKNSKVTEQVQNLQDLIKKVKPLPLPQDIISIHNEIAEAGINKSYEFLLEISDFILRNFLFNEEERMLKELVLSKTDSGVMRRFSSYEKNYHAKLKVGHLKEYFLMLKELKFEHEINLNKGRYNKQLSTEQKMDLIAFCESGNTTGDILAEIKQEIRNTTMDNYEQGEQFLGGKIEYFCDLSEIAPGIEFLQEFEFGQYLPIIEILNEGLMVKSKQMFVKRNSSRMSG
jgi:hypothetical protein